MTRKQMIRRLTAHHNRLRKEREGLQDLSNEIEETLELTSEATTALGVCIDNLLDVTS